MVASLFDISYLFSKEFTLLVLIAIVIAAQLVYYLMSKWLEDFTYRIHLSPLPLLLAGIIMLSIALLAKTILAIQDGPKNPVLALKTE